MWKDKKSLCSAEQTVGREKEKNTDWEAFTFLQQGYFISGGQNRKKGKSCLGDFYVVKGLNPSSGSFCHQQKARAPPGKQ